MFGAVPSHSQSGETWLLGTNEFMTNPTSIVRLTFEWIPKLHQRYPCLWCNVDSRNDAHLRWLRWAGFEQTATLDPHGVEGRRFYCFARFAYTAIGRR